MNSKVKLSHEEFLQHYVLNRITSGNYITGVMAAYEAEDAWKKLQQLLKAPQIETQYVTDLRGVRRKQNLLNRQLCRNL